MSFDRKSRRKRVVPVPTQRMICRLYQADPPAHAMAEFMVYSDHETSTFIRVPRNFAAYRIHIEPYPRIPGAGDRSHEFRFAQMVLDAIPRQVWDACIAAFAAGAEGEEVAKNIFTRWLDGGYDQ